MSLRQTVTDVLLTIVMGAEYRRLSNNLDSIIQKNTTINRNAFSAFLFKGDLYCHSMHKPHMFPKNRITALCAELEEEMNDYLLDRNQVVFDEKIFRQILYVLLKNADTPHEVVNMLPDFLSKKLPTFAKFTRTIPFEECHTDLVINQTNKLLQSMYVYSAGRLLY